MEKVIASIAIRVALINISSLPKTDMLIIDEGFGALDEHSVEECSKLLISLKRYFRLLLVITHVDALKDCVDQVIEISRKEKDSFVCVS
jgi:exonuclease SbcC